MPELRRYPALTVLQPWATLIVEGCKPWEFRGYPAPKAYQGRRIAIHAGARPARRDAIGALILSLKTDGGFGTALVVEPALRLLERFHQSPLSLPLSSVLGTAVLGKPLRAMDLASPRDSDRVDKSQWGWPLSDIERFAVPIPARGAQGFWGWASSEAVPDSPLFAARETP